MSTEIASLLSAPILGPIVGHTTENSVRLWIRGENQLDGRTIGFAALYDASDRYKGAKFFRLRREYSRTGTVDFDGLTADKDYSVRLGVIAFPPGPDDERHTETDDIETMLPDPDSYRTAVEVLPEEKSVAVFRTFPKTLQKLIFVFGSCRYPGILWRRKRADRIFGPVRRHFDRTKPDCARFLLMVGDRIYADMFNRSVPIGLADTEDEFIERYTTAFRSYNLSALLRSVTNYMILDDHEIEDNWSRDRLENRAGRMLFEVAISAYRSFQWVHGPRAVKPPIGVKKHRHMYYDFDCGKSPFFVVDVRTQRYKSDGDKSLVDCQGNHLLGRPIVGGGGRQTQADKLCRWLAAKQKEVGRRPKFVVTAGVFVPNGIDDIKKPGKSDSWAAFPNTRRQVLGAIIENKVQNVVFLSGDVHCSIVAEMEFLQLDSNDQYTNKLPIKAYNITSSAFYWPYPFADGDPGEFVHNSTFSKSEDSFYFGGDPDALRTIATTRRPAFNYVMNYRALGFEQEDNCTKLTVDYSKKTIDIINYDKWGQQLRKDSISL